MGGVGLIHRDVKLENLRFRLPGAENELVLLDFGLSCPAVPECERQVVGTLLYTAPEVFSKWYSTLVPGPAGVSESQGHWRGGLATSIWDVSGCWSAGGRRMFGREPVGLGSGIEINGSDGSG